ncbi:hypothetical protein BX616_009353, partial [Lobosporangium transversale]
ATCTHMAKVPQDYVIATDWLKAVNQDKTTAQSDLGYMHTQCKEASQDYSIVVDWHLNTAKQGHDTAQYYLGY